MNTLIKKAIPSPLRNLLILLYGRWRLTSSFGARKAVGQIDSEWRKRIDDVKSSPDNTLIPRNANAGFLKDYYITMHNGVKVCANGYYGEGNLNMLVENKGVHEPQEERAFAEVVECLPEQCTMLELGAYWGFYSLSLLALRPKAKCFLVEPDPVNLLSGKINFRLNGREGVFLQAGVDRSPQTKPHIISVDSFCKDNGIEHLNILHADIQGFELAMLDGAQGMLSRSRVDFVFVSTHTNALHASCLKSLLSVGYDILADADLDNTFSVDGLIVAKRRTLDAPKKIGISKKSGATASMKRNTSDVS